MMSAETRKQRKQNRAKKDRRSLRVRRANKINLDTLALHIVLSDPPLIIKHANEYAYCDSCKQTYCIGCDGWSVFCRECLYIKFNPDACLKRHEAPLKHTCSCCGRRSV